VKSVHPVNPVLPDFNLQILKDDIAADVLKIINPMKNETTDAMESMKIFFRKSTMAAMSQMVEKKK
jgi:hypothetical protein